MSGGVVLTDEQAATDVTEQYEHPFPGNALQSVATFYTDYSEIRGETETRHFTDDLDAAAVVTSVRRPAPNVLNFGGGVTHDEAIHRPVLDIDLPMKLIPSSTRGHFHLYIDHEMTWDAYLTLLRALAAAGIVEDGYVGAAERRGFTAVRLPWVSKDDIQREPYCFRCGRSASNIPDVVFFAEGEGVTPGELAREDGTFNAAKNRFACNECYIELGMPSSPTGWVAP